MSYSDTPRSKTKPIIDGLQRLNSIFAFIENEYLVAGAYFDLETLAETKLRRDEGELVQRTPILDLIAVSKLEDLQPGLHLAGVIPGQRVSVNVVQSMRLSSLTRLPTAASARLRR